MKILSYLAFLLTIGAVTVGGLSLWLDSKAGSNRILALWTLTYTAWTAPLIFHYGAVDPGTVMTAYYWAYAASLFTTPILAWLHLYWSEAPRRTQVIFLSVSLGGAALALTDSLLSGFIYATFRNHPWGNQGVTDSSRLHPWSVITPALTLAEISFALGHLIHARRKTTSGRVKRQVKLLIPSNLITFGTYFLAWAIELVWGTPNLKFLAGIPLLAANFWLILKYRYLRPDTPLLERHLASVIADAAVLLDPAGRVAGANAPACGLLGQDETEVVGMDFCGMIDDPSGFAQDWSNAQAARPIHKSFPARMGGRTFTLSLSPRYNSHGDFAGAVVFLRPLAHWDARIQALELTPRERDILLMLLECRSNADIADRLGTAEGTVKRHLHNILEKTATASRAELLTRLLAPSSQPIH